MRLCWMTLLAPVAVQPLAACQSDDADAPPSANDEIVSGQRLKERTNLLGEIGPGEAARPFASAPQNRFVGISFEAPDHVLRFELGSDQPAKVTVLMVDAGFRVLKQRSGQLDRPDQRIVLADIVEE